MSTIFCSVAEYLRPSTFYRKRNLSMQLLVLERESPNSSALALTKSLSQHGRRHRGRNTFERSYHMARQEDRAIRSQIHLFIRIHSPEN